MAEINPAEETSAGEVREFRAAPVFREEHGEGSFTRVLEQQTAKIPSHWFLAASLGCMLGALGFESVGKKRWSRIVGMWAEPLLVMGVYNKLVKMLGSR